jgi:hypothetical protein
VKLKGSPGHRSPCSDADNARVANAIVDYDWAVWLGPRQPAPGDAFAGYCGGYANWESRAASGKRTTFSDFVERPLSRSRRFALLPWDDR